MKNEFIRFNEERHEYTDIHGNPYTSCSKIISSVSKPFDAQYIAPMTAKKRDRVSREEAVKFGVTQKEVLSSYPEFSRGITTEQVLKEWKDKNEKAIKRGNRFHKAMEDYSATRTLSKENSDMAKTIKEIHDFFKSYAHSENEMVVHSETYRIAGTIDKPCWRTKTRPGTVDIFDYKTNEEIQFNNKYGDWLKAPVEHLEDCNFNKYALQKSTYAVMLQEMTGCRIGRLGLIHISGEDFQWKLIPVPYLKHEAMALMATNSFDSENISNLEVTEETEW